ncbi:MAG: radical SAM family heme chaperone HemW [bacterium]
MSERSPAEAAGLYLHVPFCRSKCPYCDFASITEHSLVARWQATVLEEARRPEKVFGRFDSLYLGGGTPSVLPLETLERLLRGVRDAFSWMPDVETTLEVNPEDVTREAAIAWCGLGINRISVGVQSFHEDELRFLGRRHTAQQARRAVELVREHGPENVGLDLMYGFAGQQRARWRATLAAAIAFEPAHLSCYMLTIESGTELGRWVADGSVRTLSERLERAFFLDTAEEIRSRGYVHYEISNFARDLSKRSRHNQKYWRHVPTLGLGPSAHSYCDRARWWNVDDVSEYVSRGETAGDVRDGCESLTAKQIQLETLFLGLRTANGVANDFLHTLPNGVATVAVLVREGLLVAEGDRVVPTLDGFALADGLPLRFEL